METDEKSRNNGTLRRRPAGWKWIFSVWGVAIIALMWQVSVRISPVAAEQPLAAAPAASALPLWANLHSEPARPAAFAAPAPPDAVELQAGPRYILLAWNDLGMHCYNPDYADIGVLPPFNTLWAQVVRVGDPPTVITAGVTLSYEFVDNSYSVGKTNFWSYASKLFGANLAPNVGLTGKGLTGTMDMAGDHFIAAGIPLTEYNDSAPTTPNPFQLAVIVARDSVSGAELARTTTVAPISSEMRCDNCHSDTGDATTRYPITPTGKIETNILALHDYLSASRYPPGHTGRLMDPARRPVLCAECHSSNALNAPGVIEGEGAHGGEPGPGRGQEAGPGPPRPRLQDRRVGPVRGQARTVQGLVPVEVVGQRVRVRGPGVPGAPLAHVVVAQGRHGGNRAQERRPGPARGGVEDRIEVAPVLGDPAVLVDQVAREHHQVGALAEHRAGQVLGWLVALRHVRQDRHPLLLPGGPGAAGPAFEHRPPVQEHPVGEVRPRHQRPEPGHVDPVGAGAGHLHPGPGGRGGPGPGLPASALDLHGPGLVLVHPVPEQAQGVPGRGAAQLEVGLDQERLVPGRRPGSGPGRRGQQQRCPGGPGPASV